MPILKERDLGTPAGKGSEAVRLVVDGHEIEVPQGSSLMYAARKAGIEMPKLCASDTLGAFGSCRLCLVEVEERKGTPASCTTPAENGSLVGNAAWDSLDLPDLGGNTCTHEPIPDCCDAAADCDDGTACTVDTCGNGTCAHDPIPGCCALDTDCNDGDSCTLDVCASGTCSNL